MADKFFDSNDGWLFVALRMFNKRILILRQLLRTGDTLNHAIFTLEEINNGLSRLESANFIEFESNRLFLTKKAKKFIKANRSGLFEPCVAESCRYCGIFEKLPLPNEVEYREYFSRDEYETAYLSILK